MMEAALLALGALRVLGEPLDHVEGVAETPDGALWAGGEAGQLYRFEADVSGSWSFEQLADTRAGMLLGLASDDIGRLYICAPEQNAILRFDPETSELVTYAEGIRTPNVGSFDANGDLIVSDSGSLDLDEGDGTIVRIPAGGGTPEILDLPALHFPNGLASLADGRLAVAESFAPRITAIDLKTGALETLVELDHAIPDGLASDTEGGLLISCFQPNVIYRYHAATGLRTVIEDWTGQKLLSPTNVAYIGRERRTIAISSLLGWSLVALDVP
jgi:gluconolactonase